MSESISVKVVIIGEPAVGKTTLTQNFVGSKMEGEYMMTLGADISEAKIKVDDNSFLEVQIWDLAGQESFKPLTSQFLSGAQGAVAVFDLTRDYTFDKLNSWLELLHEENKALENNIPFIIVGNKEDLEHLIVVKDEDVQTYLDYVNRHHIFSKADAEYIKTSAKTGARVKHAFQRLAHIIVDNFRSQDLPLKEAPTSIKQRDEDIIKKQSISKDQYEKTKTEPDKPSMERKSVEQTEEKHEDPVKSFVEEKEENLAKPSAYRVGEETITPPHSREPSTDHTTTPDLTRTQGQNVPGETSSTTPSNGEVVKDKTERGTSRENDSRFESEIPTFRKISMETEKTTTPETKTSVRDLEKTVEDKTDEERNDIDITRTESSKGHSKRYSDDEKTDSSDTAKSFQAVPEKRSDPIPTPKKMPDTISKEESEHQDPIKTVKTKFQKPEERDPFAPRHHSDQKDKPEKMESDEDEEEDPKSLLRRLFKNK